MSQTHLSKDNLQNFCNFNKLDLKEENKEEIIIPMSRGSTRHSNIKYFLHKQISLSNSNKNHNIIERNHSSINIAKIIKFSKFRINKNEKYEKNYIGKCSTNKILSILQNSKKSKITKKDCMKEENKKTEIEIESKKLRYDNFGILINKQNKKLVHILFKDQLNENSITEEIQIESFKKFNFIKGMPKDEFHPSKNPFYKCCLIY